MTVDEFTELQHRAAAPIAPTRDIDAWIDAILAGEPRGAYTSMPPAHLLTAARAPRQLTLLDEAAS